MMDKRRQDALARQIVRLAENAADIDQGGSRRTRVLGYPGGQVVLIDDFADEYDELVREFLGHADWGEKFSEKYIDKSLRALFGEVLSEDEAGTGMSERASEGVKSLVARLEGYSEEHTCYVPLVGLHLSAGDVALGRVVLKTLSDTVVDQLESTIESILMSTRHSEEEKKYFVEMHKQIVRNLKGGVCAQFRAIAEPDKARQRAEDETRRVIDLLRFSIPVLYEKEWNVAIGFLGEVFGSSRITPTFSEGRFNLNILRVGPHTELELSETHMKTMQEIGVFEMADVLRKDTRDVTKFENTLLRGIHWFADAQVQPESENKLLSLMTSLEVFLTNEGNNPIRKTVAEGVAMIVAEGAENRMKLKAKILRLYDQRSGVSHGGSMVVLPSDLEQLEAIAHTLLRTLIKRKDEFSAQKDLARWLEEQRLA